VRIANLTLHKRAEKDLIKKIKKFPGKIKNEAPICVAIALK
jgi:hypothetical protein